jgi:D-alanyl-lipoteichoic acid acyltransferase DltB (MBOAT superfamily)
VSFLSFAFAVFVGVTLLAFYLAPARYRQHVLLAASYAFYATHAPVFAQPLLLAVTYGVHRIALAIDAAEAELQKWRLSAVSVTTLVIVLAGFKLLASAASPGTEHGAALTLLIPLGISYYLFKLIAYVLEVYWGNVPAERDFVRVALYAAFFPQVVSGPIQRPGTFFAQVERLGEPDAALVSQGLRRILFGLFKKIAIADRLAVPVDAVFGDPSACSSLELVLGGYLFALQLYADFSGVTDVAIGLGKLVGITGPENFSLPFFARNLQEYWRRWHQSLTSWLADYLFTPLSLALRGQGQAGLALAVLVNMFTVGIWHGIGSSYAAFGVYHGICLVISVFTLKARDRFFRKHLALAPVRAVVSRLVTFHLVVVGLVIFRAPTLDVSYEYFAALVQGLSGSAIAATRIDFKLLQLTPKALVMIGLLAAVAELIHWARTQPSLTSRFLQAPRPYRWAAYYTVIVVTLALSRPGEGKFIYAQF